MWTAVHPFYDHLCPDPTLLAEFFRGVMQGVDANLPLREGC